MISVLIKNMVGRLCFTRYKICVIVNFNTENTIPTLNKNHERATCLWAKLCCLNTLAGKITIFDSPTVFLKSIISLQNDRAYAGFCLFIVYF